MDKGSSNAEPANTPVSHKQHLWAGIAIREKRNMKVEFEATIKEKFPSSWVASLLKIFPRFRGDWLLFARFFAFFPKAIRTVQVEIFAR